MPERLRVYDTVERRWFETYAVNLAEIQASEPGRFNLDGSPGVERAVPVTEPEPVEEDIEPEVEEKILVNGKMISANWRERSPASQRLTAVAIGAPKTIKAVDAVAYIEAAVEAQEQAAA